MTPHARKSIFFPLLTIFSMMVIIFLLYGLISEYKGRKLERSRLEEVLQQPLHKIRLHRYHSHLKYVEGYVEGKLCKFLFTTGGGETIISPRIVSADSTAYAQDSVGGITLDQKKLSYGIKKQVDVTIGNLTLPHDYVLVKDIMQELPAGWKEIDGIISTKAFADFIFTVDWTANAISIESEERTQHIQSEAIAFDLKYVKAYNKVGLSVLTNLSTPYGNFWFELDNGKKYNTLSNNRSDQIKETHKEKYKAYDLNQYNVASIQLLNLCSSATEIPVKVESSLLGDGVLGSMFFKHWLLTFDFNNHRLYCRPNPYNKCT